MNTEPELMQLACAVQQACIAALVRAARARSEKP